MVALAADGDSEKTLGHRQIGRRRDLQVPRIALHDPDGVSGLLGEHGFVGRVTAERQRLFQHRGSKGLRRLRQVNLLHVATSLSRRRSPRALDGVVRRHGRDRRTRFGCRRDGSSNRLIGHERPGRIMNDDDVRAIGDTGERVRHGVLAACAAGHDLDPLPVREQRRRRVPASSGAAPPRRRRSHRSCGTRRHCARESSGPPATETASAARLRSEGHGHRPR